MNKAAIIVLLSAFLAGSARYAFAEDGYQVISITDGGTITGTVKWVGPLPHLTTLPITKDPQICDPESAKTRDLERLIVGPPGWGRQYGGLLEGCLARQSLRSS